jgi:hypothetical protein
MGDDEALLDVVTSANVACGFHAGDPVTMLRTCRAAAAQAPSPHRRTPQRGRRTRLHPATPDGRPVLFGPDHPITGGYPVVGVLTDASCDLLAQLRPGQRVRFRAVAK